MPNAEIDYKAVRRRVEKDLQKQKRLTRSIFTFVTLVLYTLFMVLGWAIFSKAAGTIVDPELVEDLMTGMVMLSIAGGMGLLFQFIGLVLDTKSGEASMRERLVSRAIGAELLQLGEEYEELEGSEPKAKRMMRLSDDGELDEVIDDEVLTQAEMDAMQARRR